MTDRETAAALRRLFATYDGIVNDDAGSEGGGSRIIERQDGRLEGALVFEESAAGRAAGLVVDFVLSGTASWIRRAGPPERTSKPSDGGPASTCLVGDRAQMAVLARAMAYASTRMLAPAPPEAFAAPGDGPTLPALLSHALIAFTQAYNAAPALGVPSLPVWSNVLRPLAGGVLTERELGHRAVLSRRVVEITVRELSGLAWLEREKGAKARAPKTVRLKAPGQAMEAAGRARVADVEARWVGSFGAARMRRLRDGLAAAAAQLDLEMPWYVAGYGIGDASLTGGNYLPAEPGPPRIPGRGQEWPVTARSPATDWPAMPLSALLSWALAAFTLDYEAEESGSLAWASTLLRHVPDEGLPLRDAQALCDARGNGRSGPERHMCLVVAPGRGRDRDVYLTPKSRRMRATWAWQVAQIERRWRDRLGAETFDDLRGLLESMDAEAWSGLSDYPDTTSWALGHRLRQQGSSDALPDQQNLGPGHNLAWHAGQHSAGRQI